MIHLILSILLGICCKECYYSINKRDDEAEFNLQCLFPGAYSQITNKENKCCYTSSLGFYSHVTGP